MTQPVTTAQTPPISQRPQNYSPAGYAAALFKVTCLAAGIPALAALAVGTFTTISPLGAAIFGATAFLSGWHINWICEKVNCGPDSIVAKVANFSLPLIGGIGSAFLVTSLAGFPMTVTSIVILTCVSGVLSGIAGLAAMCHVLSLDTPGYQG